MSYRKTMLFLPLLLFLYSCDKRVQEETKTTNPHRGGEMASSGENSVVAENDCLYFSLALVNNDDREQASRIIYLNDEPVCYNSSSYSIMSTFPLKNGENNVIVEVKTNDRRKNGSFFCSLAIRKNSPMGDLLMCGGAEVSTISPSCTIKTMHSFTIKNGIAMHDEWDHLGRGDMEYAKSVCVKIVNALCERDRGKIVAIFKNDTDGRLCVDSLPQMIFDRNKKININKVNSVGEIEMVPGRFVVMAIASGVCENEQPRSLVDFQKQNDSDASNVKRGWIFSLKSISVCRKNGIWYLLGPTGPSPLSL